MTAEMGSACSGLANETPISLDEETLERLQREFNDVDVGKVGRIGRGQFEAILLKRAFSARASEAIEYQIGGILDKSLAYKGKAVAADRSLVRMSKP